MARRRRYYDEPVKKELEFAQKMVVVAYPFSMSFVFIMNVANFILLWTGRQPMTQETISAITTFGNVTSGLAFSAYGTLNAIRAWSMNKYCGGKLPEERFEEGDVEIYE